MKTLTKAKSAAPPTERWRWRTNRGPRMLPEEMASTHLFFTLRMIWNNHCPEQHTVGDVKRYKFGGEYTPEYFRQAVQQIVPELQTWKDLPTWMIQHLDEMWKHFHNRIETEEKHHEYLL